MRRRLPLSKLNALPVATKSPRKRNNPKDAAHPVAKKAPRKRFPSGGRTGSQVQPLDDASNKKSQPNRQPARSTVMRQKMKENDPTRYEEYLKDARERSKKRREELKKLRDKRRPTPKNVETIEKIRAQDRARAKKYYMRKKQQNTVTSAPNTTAAPLECIPRVSRTEYWRKWKSDRRRELSRQKQEAIRSYDRKRKSPHASHVTPRQPGCGGKSSVTTKDLIDTIKDLRKDKKGAKAIRLLASKLKARASRTALQKLGLPRTKSASKNRKPSGIFTARKKAITNFFLRTDVSRILPSKKFATKAGAGRMLEMTLSQAMEMYNEQHPNLQVKSLSYFRNCKPKNVRLLTTNLREYCCCVYCVQIRLKLRALNKLKPGSMTSEYQISENLLCPKSSKDRFYKIDCVYGRCTACCDIKEKLLTYTVMLIDQKWCIG